MALWPFSLLEGSTPTPRPGNKAGLWDCLGVGRARPIRRAKDQELCEPKASGFRNPSLSAFPAA